MFFKYQQDIVFVNNACLRLDIVKNPCTTYLGGYLVIFELCFRKFST